MYQIVTGFTWRSATVSWIFKECWFYIFSVLELGPGKPELVPNMTLKCQTVMRPLHYALRFILTVLDCKPKIAVKSFQSRLWCKLHIADSRWYFAHFKILWLKFMLITNKFLIHSAVMNSGLESFHSIWIPVISTAEIPLHLEFLDSWTNADYFYQ